MRTLAKLLCLTIALPTLAWAEPSAIPSPQPDKLRDALTEMITSVTKTVGEGKAFVVAQAPEFAREYLAWELVKANIWMWVSAVATLLIIALATCLLWPGEGRKEVATAGGWLVVLSMVLLGITTANVLDVVKIRTAPSIVLVEYAKSLVK